MGTRYALRRDTARINVVTSSLILVLHFQEEKFALMEAEFHSKHAELTQQLQQVSEQQGIDVNSQDKVC